MVRTARFAFDDDDRFDHVPTGRDFDALDELPLPEDETANAARGKRARRRPRRTGLGDLAGADWMQDERESA